MNHCLLNSTRTRRQLVLLLLVALSMTLPFSANAGNKKESRHNRRASGWSA